VVQEILALAVLVEVELILDLLLLQTMESPTRVVVAVDTLAFGVVQVTVVLELLSFVTLVINVVLAEQ
jgi:hypothetical protein